MSIDIENSATATVEIPTPARLTIEARNMELLQHRDAALLLAFRFTGSRADAEDILQEAYLKAVRAREPLLTGDALRKWFFQIAANTAVNALRSEQRRRVRERSAAAMQETMVPERAGPEAAELKQDLENELAALEEKYRTAISLHYEQGFSYEEAAEILETPAGTLRSYASQGIKMLRARMERPSRGLTAEALLALLAAGAVLKPSEAFAATVQTLVTVPPLLAGAPATAPASAGTASSNGPLGATASSAPSAAATGGVKVFASATGTGIGFAWKVAGAFGVLLVTFALGAATGILVDRNLTQTESKPALNPERLVEDMRPANLPKGPVVAPIEPAPEIVDTMPMVAPMVKPRQIPAVPKDKLLVGKVAGQSVQDYVPPPEVEAEWANAVDLMKNIKPQRDACVGDWTLIDGKLAMKPAKFARLAIPCSAPEEYDFRVDFTRDSGWADVDMIFGVNGKSATWMMGAVQGDQYCFGHHNNNPQVVRRPAIANGVRHTCIVQVRKQSLTAYLDGVLIQGIEIGKARYETSSDLRLPDASWFGLGGWLNTVQFHRVAVRELTGKVEIADPKIFEVNNSVAYWANTKVLTPKELDNSRVLGGEWRVQGGKLSMVAREDHARMQLNYQPPEEYDLLVDFTRTQGRRGLLQILSVKGQQFIVRVDEDGISGMDQVAGQHFYTGPFAMHTTQIENYTKHRSIICVRKDSLRLFVDGKLWMRWAPADYESMDLEQIWRLKSPTSLGLGAYKSNMTFDWILVKELSGPGKDLPDGNIPLPPEPAVQAVAPPQPGNGVEGF